MMMTYINLIVFIIFLINECYSFRITRINSKLKTLRVSSSETTTSAQTVSSDNIDLDNAVNFVKKNIHKISFFSSFKSEDNSSEDEDELNLLLMNLKGKEIGGGNTNFNYKIYDTRNESQAVFIKHAKNFAKGFGEDAKMSTERLNYEYRGMLEFEKFGFASPDTYIYDSNENYLVTSFLDGYEPLIDELQRHEIDPNTAVIIGSMLGHVHSATHEEIVPAAQHEIRRRQYSNDEHFELWDQFFFPMSLNRLKNLELIKQTDDVASFGEDHYKLVKKFCQECEENNKGSIDKWILGIEQVQSVYMNKKTTMVHADLHCNNIMVKRSDSSNNENNNDMCDLMSTKMIDFEKFAMGPPGLDLGQFLANYIWFWPTGDSDHILENALNECWDNYIESFIYHAKWQCKVNNRCLLPDTEAMIIEDTLHDAVGFLGWWLLTLNIACPVDVMPLQDDYSPWLIPVVRTKQLEIATTFLEAYVDNEKVLFKDLIEMISTVLCTRPTSQKIHQVDGREF